MESIAQGCSIYCVLNSDPELEAENNTLPHLRVIEPWPQQSMAGLPMSLKALKLLLFPQEPKESFCALISLPQTQRHLIYNRPASVAQ